MSHGRYEPEGHRRPTIGEGMPALERIARIAEANGVGGDLTWLSAEEVHELEPVVSAVRGLWSPCHRNHRQPLADGGA